MKRLSFVFVWLVFQVGLAHEGDLRVPEEVMGFILGCEGRFEGGGSPTIPVSQTDIDPTTGTEIKKMYMMDISQLRKSLVDTVESDEVVHHILSQVEESLAARHSDNARQDTHCTNIKIDVPLQEVKGLSEQLQAVIQQNNYQLLEQINTLFTFKLNSFYREIEELLTLKLGELANGLVQLQQNQQTPVVTMPESQPAPETPDSSVGETRIFQFDHRPFVPPSASPSVEREPENTYSGEDSDTQHELEPKLEPQMPKETEFTDLTAVEEPDEETEESQHEEEEGKEVKTQPEEMEEAKIQPEEEEKDAVTRENYRKRISHKHLPRTRARIGRPNLSQSSKEAEVESQPDAAVKTLGRPQRESKENPSERAKRNRMEAMQERRRVMLERLRGR